MTEPKNWLVETTLYTIIFINIPYTTSIYKKILQNINDKYEIIISLRKNWRLQKLCYYFILKNGKIYQHLLIIFLLISSNFKNIIWFFSFSILSIFFFVYNQTQHNLSKFVSRINVHLISYKLNYLITFSKDNT